jgi:hypothetical protein
MVRVDDVATPLPAITNANGVNFLDPHPDDASCLAMEFQTKPEGNSLLHYTVTVTYFAPPAAAPGSGESGGTPPELLPGIPSVWTATSSVGSYPVRADVNGKVIANSAGTPLPKLEADRACFKLTLKRPFGDYSWESMAVNYTNAVNSDTWMGQPARCWKCQGFSASQETQNEGGLTRSYWMVSIEFEYRAPEKGLSGKTHPGWDLTVLDQGYQCMVDENGKPDMSPSNKIGTIRDAKGQPIKEPVGLDGFGFAVTPPRDPAILVFQIYKALPFTAVFGV